MPHCTCTFCLTICYPSLYLPLEAWGTFHVWCVDYDHYLHDLLVVDPNKDLLHSWMALLAGYLRSHVQRLCGLGQQCAGTRGGCAGWVVLSLKELL